MSTIPEIKTDTLYQLLRDDKVKEFNERRAKGEPCDLQNADMRSMDLRGLEAKGLDEIEEMLKNRLFWNLSKKKPDELINIGNYIY